MNSKYFDYKNTSKLVEIKNLSKWFPIKQSLIEIITKKEIKYVKALNGVSFDIYKGENLGLVGESGCGKSTLCKTLVRLYEPTQGEIFLNGENISKKTNAELKPIRSNMQMIFQDPYSSLNPRMTVYEIIEEMLLVHKIVPKNKIKDRIKELLEMSGLSMDLSNRFPGEFSGGQRQRIGIARSLSLNPKFIIADEPVSALDVSIQAQIINLLSDLRDKLGLTLLFISHDLRVVKHITNRVVVMYLGSVVELGDTDDIFLHPLHPYTLVLTKAAPILDPRDRNRDYAIEGDIPSPIDMPKGCNFHPRCVYCKNICKEEIPKLKEVSKDRFVACHFPISYA